VQTPGHLPNLLIIGAAKAGTTSLHRYLDLHPAIFMSHDKELQLFNRDDWRDRIGWYREQFPEPAEVRGESSPAYSMDPWFPSVPERIRELIPDVRVVYLVRDPIERLVAQYVEFYALRRENRSLDDALRDFASPSNRIVMSSRFAYQLDRYRAHFDDAQILVLDQRDLLESRAATLRETFAFLGVDPDFTSPEFDRLHNERGQKLRIKAYGAWLYGFGVLQPLRSASRRLPAGARERLKLLVADPVSTPALDPALRAEVEAYLREDADRLRAYTGKPFAHWSV
jgi:hypothetical protein